MIATERLVLRPWRNTDRAPFHAMSRDPEVMAHLGPVTASKGDIDANIDRQVTLQSTHGHCFWALERRDDGVFLGFCGLKLAPEPITDIEGEIEIGWRLRRDAWGQGYAREAARASLAWGFDRLAVSRIIGLTTPGNTRSWGLMERLGMIRRADLDFDHPALAADDPLRPHIVYEARRP